MEEAKEILSESSRDRSETVIPPENSEDDSPLSSRSPQGYPIIPLNICSDPLDQRQSENSPHKNRLPMWNNAVSPFQRNYLMSPIYNGSSTRPHIYSGIDSAGFPEGYGSDWRSTNAYFGASSTRNSAVQYLNMNQLIGSQNSPSLEVEPPGFPPIEQSENSHNRNEHYNKYSEVPTPGVSMKPEQTNLSFWGGVGTPTMVSDWSDGGLTTWTQRNNFHPNGFYPTPSPLNNGGISTSHLHSFQSPFGRTDGLFFYPKERHNDAPTDKAPSCPTPINESEHFSPWKNLHSLPDCKPINTVKHENMNEDGFGKMHDSIHDMGLVSDFPSTPAPMSFDDERMGPSSPNNLRDGVGHNSVGSSNHPNDCRPCAFYWTKGCINGQDCRFCHEWHPPKKKKPMKEQKNLMIIARPDGKIEFMRCTVFEAMRVL